jgi:uncharacterized protein (TIGR00645 family)
LQRAFCLGPRDGGGCGHPLAAGAWWHAARAQASVSPGIHFACWARFYNRALSARITPMLDPAQPVKASPMRPLPRLIFASRWLQLPLYLGLIVAQCVYVVHFLVELLHLVEAAFGSQTALQALVNSIGYKTVAPITTLNETVIMLVVLALIDVVMISNLLIMVIVGGYETFVSRMQLEGHEDQPEWLSHVNASVLKVKLAMSIIGISSIHLLKTFINADNYSEKVLIAQTVIHIAFLLSAMAIAYTDKLMSSAAGRTH